MGRIVGTRGDGRAKREWPRNKARFKEPFQWDPSSEVQSNETHWREQQGLLAGITAVLWNVSGTSFSFFSRICEPA